VKPIDSLVAVTGVDPAVYPGISPFDPPESYPELGAGAIDPSNGVYPAVRRIFHSLKFDERNYGTASWNPLGEVVRPGMTVFIKPNTVMHRHEKGKDIFSVIVHASVLRPILDYVLLALKGQGRVIIGDSQLINGHFDEALAVSGIGSLVEWFRQRSPVRIDCIDLRMQRGARSWLYGKWRRVPVMQDLEGYAQVDLADRSMFRDVDSSRLRIAVASYREMRKSHGPGKHIYTFPRSFLQSDVVINVAKLKTHRRTAVTLCLKNFMGIPSAKGSLPHFTVGAPQEGGDQYVNPCLRKRICTGLHDVIQTSRFIPVKFVCAVVKKLIWNTHWLVPFRDDIYEAMWPGNDTVWRTLLDLNRIVVYADKDGIIRNDRQRRLVCLIDGIIGGEGDGPLAPDPVASGTLMGGMDPVAMDCVAATLMGFDIGKIRLIREGLADRERALPITVAGTETIRVAEDDGEHSLEEYGRRRNLHFKPHPGWKGHIERE
jgi:uncharacterized protein (DUF362 family)